MELKPSPTSFELSDAQLKALQIMARRLRKHSLLSTTASKSGHPSTCFSCAEIVTSIFFQFLRFDLKNPDSSHNDRFVLSKGHAAPILWAALAEGGAFPVDELINLRKIDSILEGHPTPRSPYVDVATGSLGQGLSNAVGMAFSARVDNTNSQVYVLMGDGETAEGAVWEAAALASHYSLSNLIAVVDVNRLGQSEATMYQHDLNVYRDRFEAFGWDTVVVDGHSFEEIYGALEAATNNNEAPSAIIAKTLKGKGVSFMEDVDGWHGKPVVDPDLVKQALEELGEDEELSVQLTISEPHKAVGGAPEITEVVQPEYGLGEMVATREAYGSGLAKLGASNSNVVALDGDCKNSTYSDRFAKKFPDRFLECYIAEQNMVGAAAGLAAMGKTPFASSFACFLSRAYDFIRMSAISQVNLKLCGSHAGVSIGEDGPSQMALEDLAMMRAIVGSTVLYPSDAVSTERLVALASETPGIVYLRTSRPKTPVIYTNTDSFQVGGSKTVRSSENDQVTVVSAGVTLHEAVKAADELAKEGIRVRVVDLYCVKPVDAVSINAAARETGRIITVEDHYPEGGIGEAVKSALNEPCTFRMVAVTDLPRSGGSAELLDRYGLSARGIAAAIRDAL